MASHVTGCPQQPLHRAVIGGCFPAAWVLYAIATLAGDSNVMAAQSNIGITFEQESVPLEASFKTFSGEVIYDPSRPRAAHAALTVMMSSFDVGNTAYNAELHKASWFDTERFATATFQTQDITPKGATRFTATGLLTIKGHTQSTKVAVTVGSMGTLKIFDGTFSLSRKAFGIGDSTWDDVLDDTVQVRFHLVGTGH
jgi:polyisoprenoid-binding protein YceI